MIFSFLIFLDIFWRLNSSFLARVTGIMVFFMMPVVEAGEQGNDDAETHDGDTTNNEEGDPGTTGKGYIELGMVGQK